MKPVIVDSNKIFSALLSKASIIRRILIESKSDFFAPNFLVAEIYKHKEKIQQIAKEDEDTVYKFLVEILDKIEFINEKRISTANLIHAHRLCSDIDENDILFVALTLELNGKLWTGDEALKSGLRKKGFTAFFDPMDNF